MEKTTITGTIESKKQMYSFVPYLKALAVLLVINSHLDGFYPISAMATGGALGNALFFLVSGFCLANIKKDFFSWYKYRVMRIYPQTVVMAIVMFALFTPAERSVTDMLTLIIWPTKYWFIGAIVLFYIPFYFVFKDENRINKRFWLIVIVLVALYVICYQFLDTSKWVVEYADVTHFKSYFRFIIYLLIFIFGGYLNHRAKAVKSQRANFLTDIIIAGLNVAALYMSKYLMDKGYISYSFQFTNQVFVFLFAVFTIKGCLCIRHSRTKALEDVVQFFSERSLYYYLGHLPFIHVTAISGLVFPINVLVFIIATVVVSEFFYRLVGGLQKKYLR